MFKDLHVTISFFKAIDTIIDWAPLEKNLKKVYRKEESVDGRPSFPGLLLFKNAVTSDMV